MEYGSCEVVQVEFESVQKRAVRFVTGDYSYETGSMTGILGQLTLKAPPIICSRRRLQIYPLFQK